MTQKIDYAIYPSLLDSYARFKRHDEDEDTFTQLMNRLNKVQSPPDEKRLRGIAFEKAVEQVLSGAHDLGIVDGENGDMEAITVDGFHFKKDLVNTIAGKLLNNTGSQVYSSAVFTTDQGVIKLYGITDYEFPSMIVDLKTTEEYKCNKYKDHYQHPIYSLIRKANGNPIQQFKYLVTDFNEYYVESYVPTENQEVKLWRDINEFIRWINHMKKHIKDQTVFGG